MRFQKKLSPRTIKAYEREFVSFTSNLNHWFKKSPVDFEQKLLKEYLDRFSTENNSLARLRMHAAAIKRWYLETHGQSLDCTIQVSRQQPPRMRVLRREELQLIFGLSSNHICGLMLRMVFGSGLRLNEVTRLKVSDLDFVNRQIHIQDEQGNYSHTTLLPSNLELEICREKDGKPDDEHLFSLRQDRRGRCIPISRRTLQSFLAQIVRENNLGELSLHVLRDNFALHLLGQGVDHKYIASLMGFRNVRSIQRYVRAIKSEQIHVRSPL